MKTLMPKCLVPLNNFRKNAITRYTPRAIWEESVAQPMMRHAGGATVADQNSATSRRLSGTVRNIDSATGENIEDVRNMTVLVLYLC